MPVEHFVHVTAYEGVIADEHSVHPASSKIVTSEQVLQAD